MTSNNSDCIPPSSTHGDGCQEKGDDGTNECVSHGSVVREKREASVSSVLQDVLSILDDVDTMELDDGTVSDNHEPSPFSALDSPAVIGTTFSTTRSSCGSGMRGGSLSCLQQQQGHENSSLPFLSPLSYSSGFTTSSSASTNTSTSNTTLNVSPMITLNESLLLNSLPDVLLQSFGEERNSTEQGMILEGNLVCHVNDGSCSNGSTDTDKDGSSEQ